jgi:hypothetical protein
MGYSGRSGIQEHIWCCMKGCNIVAQASAEHLLSATKKWKQCKW